MAKILNTTLDEIYEPKDDVYVISGDYAHGIFWNTHTFNANSEFVFDTIRKYIQKLEQEIVGLKKRLV